MRADIQFSKFGKQRTKGQQIMFVAFYALAFLCIAVAGVVFAYFTASAQLKVDTSFGRISVAFVDGSDNYLTDANFDTKFVNKINPGDIIDLSGVKIKNNGTHEAYVLVNVDISIEKTGATTLHYNKWYNIYGQEVNSNFSSNATTPTLLTTGSTADTNIKWTIPGDVVGTEYANATANITMTAYGSQTNLQRTSTYVNPKLYASYYICKTAEHNQSNNTGKNLLNLPANLEFLQAFSQDAVIPAGTYTLSWTSATTTGTVQPAFAIGNGENGKNCLLAANGGSHTFTVTGDWDIIHLYANDFWWAGSEGHTATITNLMLEAGSTATEYEPYKADINMAQISGEPLMKIVTSKNLLNTNAMELGIFDQTTGEPADSNNQFRSMYEIPCKNGDAFVQSNTNNLNLRAFFYGASDEFVSTTTWSVNGYIVAPANAKYMKFITGTIGNISNLTTYQFQIESGTTATSWQAYSEAEDTIDYSTGVVTRNINKLELTGNEVWQTQYAPHILFNVQAAQYGMPNDYNVLCSHAPSRSQNSYFGAETTNANGSCLGFSNCFEGFGVSSIDEFKAYLAEQYALGTPVTLWYRLKTPYTEYATASKNVYTGIQDRHFTTGADDNNTSEATNIMIKSDLSYGYNSNDNVNLGPEVFDVMWNNPTVVSYKMRRTVNDIVGSAHVSVSYYDSNSTLLGNKIDKTNKCPNDGSYHLMYITVPALSTLYDGQITWIRLQLSDYSSPKTSRDFTIKDIQIEIGESPTDYEPYEKAIYSYVNGKALYTTGDTFDTYNGSTKTITRNVNTYMFDTSKNYSFVNNSDENYVSVYMNNTQFINPPSVDTYNAKILCSHLNYRFDEGYYKDRTDEGIMGYGDYSAAFMMTFAVSRVGETEEDFESWVVRERANGTPLMIYFEMATPYTETI